MTYLVYYAPSLVFPFGPAPKTVDVKQMRFITELEAAGLEQVFRLMNVVDGTELPVKLKVRSLSVGDVVVEKASGKKWYCASIGWKEIDG